MNPRTSENRSRPVGRGQRIEKRPPSIDNALRLACDAVIIGAGHNGLAAAVILAEAGWKVRVLERNPLPGGAVRTAEVTLPGFRHDLFATNLNLFGGSPFYRRYGDRLARHGLELLRAQAPFCSVFPGGGLLGVWTDLDRTAAGIERCSRRDALAWRMLVEEFERVAPSLFPLLGQPMPSWGLARQLWAGTRRLGRRWPLDLLRLLLQSPREWAEERFESRQVHSLCAAWGMHLDFPPEMAGGALFPFLECMVGQTQGMSLGRGGAGAMIDAMVSLLENLGGEVELESPVCEVIVQGGRARGVVLESGERVEARRAVIANLTPTQLFGRLVRQEVSAGFARRVSNYRYGPGTMMIHLALSDLPPWRTREAREFCYVHVAPYLEDLGLAYQQAVSGLLPVSPLLVVGQPTVVDPSRAPEGKHVLWIQVRVVPAVIRGDAAGTIPASDWSQAREPFADRVLAKLEEYAPGLGQLVLARHVMAPTDLEAANPNLVGGDNLTGSHHLSQNFLFRPFLGWSRYRTPVEGLYLCGAATWPGAGVGAGSGTILGNQLI